MPRLTLINHMVDDISKYVCLTVIIEITQKIAKFVNFLIFFFFMECCYIPVLLWKRILLSWSHILKTARARHSNVILLDCE